MLSLNSRRVLLSCAVLCALYWVAFWGEEWSKDRWRTAYSASQRPPVVDGLVLRFAPFLNKEPEVTPVGGATVVLVYSDECPYSQAQANDWLAIMKLPEADQVSDVLLVRTGIGRQIESALLEGIRNGRRRVQSVNVKDRIGFMEATGIAWTPATIVIDSGSHVRFVAERLDATSTVQVRRFVQISPPD